MQLHQQKRKYQFNHCYCIIRYVGEKHDIFHSRLWIIRKIMFLHLWASDKDVMKVWAIATYQN